MAKEIKYGTEARTDPEPSAGAGMPDYETAADAAGYYIGRRMLLL